jgi:raffinose/stachyose/melibiose transport system permease protein
MLWNRVPGLDKAGILSPREVFEAAIMDGANIFQMFSQIAVPMVAKSIVTLSLVQFFFVWND